MRAYQYFIHELNRLTAFYKATIYSYEQTETLLYNWKRNKLKFDYPSESGLTVKQPHYYKTKKSSQNEVRKNLFEVVFVRVLSSLEVFLVDIIKETFLENKEPFKKQDIIVQFTQAELLSIKSPTEVFNKIISKECRKLTSGGFSEIVKYYKKYFDTDLSGFAPGKSKMEEYHERRHLLVHRLGKTDQHYREKYSTSKQSISIDETYLLECITNFKFFAQMVNNQMIYKLKNEFIGRPKKEKLIERKLTLEVLFISSSEPKYFQPHYEFWAGDNFSMFSEILDSKKIVDANKVVFMISGTFSQLKSFSKIIRRAQRKKEIILEIIDEKIVCRAEVEPRSERLLDEEIINIIKHKLPPQPWEKGIHKKVAEELNVANKLVSLAIHQLISQKIFKQQIDGIIIEEESNIDTKNK